MTIQIIKGHDFSDNTISAAKLNDLVDEAQIYEINPTHLATGVDLFRNSEPASDEGRAYLNSTTGEILFHNGSTFVNLVEDPYKQIFTNGGVATLMPSWVVVVDIGLPVGSVRLSVNPTHDFRVCGVVADNIINPAATGYIYMRGIVPVTVFGQTFTASQPGAYLFGPDVGRKEGATVEDDPNSVATYHSAYFGMALESVPTIGSSSTMTIMAWIWR